MAQGKSSSEPLPGTIFTLRQVHILKWAVLIMGVILIVGFALVMAAIVYQAKNLSESSPVPSTTSSSAAVRALAIPKGMSISHMAFDDNRLAVHLQGTTGSEIRIIDLGTGEQIQRIPVTAE